MKITRRSLFGLFGFGAVAVALKPLVPKVVYKTPMMPVLTATEAQILKENYHRIWAGADLPTYVYYGGTVEITGRADGQFDLFPTDINEG